MPRSIEFDPEPALTAAMEAFRRDGYGRTSIKDLERETGLSSGSLYNSFGDKDAIFGKALSHYNEAVVTRRMDEHLTPQSPIEGLRSLFLSLLDEPGGGSSGCLLTNSAVEFGAGDAAVKDLVQEGFQIQEEAFLGTIAQLPNTSSDPSAQALKLLALYQGILVLIRLGYPKPKLRDMINHELDNLQGDRK
jgi:TetR/AcrR family transcriptional regulator, transcriptional repressor for nem operon